MARKKSAGVFAPFIEETMNTFGYLVRDFGFEHFDTSFVSYEASVKFRKENRVAVAVFCEYGALPWVMLTGRVGGRTVEAALDFVIELRCPDRRIEVRERETPAPQHEVEKLLRHYATALRECASDVLHGDSSVLRQVKPLVDADYKRRQQEMRREEKQAAAKSKKK